jgi:3'-phosphoadenosine 5'-phosphosulfate sulfotransferase (PAPS reductase)/FAD synthetase
MMMTREELRERQGWSLEQKIDHSIATIESFVSKLGGVDKVAVSWSGGKDSTVLLHLCKRLFPDILAVFCNTTMEWPSIIQFVNKYKRDGGNVVLLRPKMNARQIYSLAFPMVSKEVSENVHAVKVNPNSVKARKALGIENPKSMFKLNKRWMYLIDEPYNIDNCCCDYMKKRPVAKFCKETGRSMILGTMASESLLRETQYIRNGGCNVFAENGGRRENVSMPLSIWTEQDIWNYIKRFNVEIPDIYYKGAKRTGCVACSYGSVFKDDDRFNLLYQLEPKYYNMVMNYTNNGVTYREALRKMFATVGRYLPDEKPKNLFDFNEQTTTT